MLLVLIFLLALGAWAQDPSPEPSPRRITPQKVNTSDPAAINPGQVKVGITYYTYDGEFKLDSTGQPRNFVGDTSDQFFLKLTFGLVDDLDLAVQGGEGLLNKGGANVFAHPTHGAGASDIQVTGRWRFVHEDDLQIAYTFGPTIAAGSPGSATQLAIGQGFSSWRHAIVTRQDYDPFTLNLGLFHSFPLEGKATSCCCWACNASSSASTPTRSRASRAASR